MTDFTIPLPLKLLSLLLSLYLFYRRLRPCPARNSPNFSPLPGPPTLPLLGNALQFPSQKPWKQLKVWADKYGPIYQISALGKTFVVLGSEEVCNDLLRARGDVYSDRHYITVLRGEIHLPVLGYGDTWRRQRKFFHFAQLQCQIATNPHYVAALTQNIKRTMEELLAVYSTTSPAQSSPPPQTPTSTSTSTTAPTPQPDLKTHWHHILEGYICGTVSQLAYGYTVRSSTEKYVRDWVGFYNEFEKAAEPARYSVNVFPWLRFFPPWRWSGKEYLRREREVIMGMFAGVGERMMNGRITSSRRTEGKKADEEEEEEEEPWSIAGLYHLNPGKWTTTSESTNLSPEEAAYTLGAFIEASMAGTPAALKVFFQAMLWYPEWQDRIYDEICGVCGSLASDATTKTKAESRGGGGGGGGGGGAGAGVVGESKKPPHQPPRMPQPSDLPHLPTIRAVIKEMLRWRPTLPGGFPHRLMRDDIYTPPSSSSSSSSSTTTSTSTSTQPPLSTPTSPPPNNPPSYLLKRNTLFLWHHYTLTRSRTHYPDPETFNPSRFLRDPDPDPPPPPPPHHHHPNPNSTTTTTSTLNDDPAFGFGRRTCPGARIAEDMMGLCIAWVVVGGVVERKKKKQKKEEGENGREGEAKEAEGCDGGGGGGGRFEPVAWDECEEGRPTRPLGFEFVIRERRGWRERLGGMDGLVD